MRRTGAGRCSTWQIQRVSTMYYSKVGSCPLALLQEHLNMDEVISDIVIVGNPGGMRHARGGGGPAAGEPSGRARSAAASARCVMRS